ncbi:MAG TPA: SH3 domain-containing protein [Pyrinomonadaceae bacterium]|jgi:SH3-like domain-containing protein
MNKPFTLIASLALSLAALAGTAPARRAGHGAQAIDPPATRCDIRAYVVDPDPRGLNVRSGAGKAFPVVGTIKHFSDATVGVTVVGATGQWVLIKDAETQEEGASAFKGSGWVYAPMLATQTRNYTGLDPDAPRVKIFKAQSRRSAVVTVLPNETEVNLVGCKGAWAQVRYKKFEGWLDPDSQCSNTLTTCS